MGQVYHDTKHYMDVQSLVLFLLGVIVMYVGVI